MATELSPETTEADRNAVCSFLRQRHPHLRLADDQEIAQVFRRELEHGLEQNFEFRLRSRNHETPAKVTMRVVTTLFEGEGRDQDDATLRCAAAVLLDEKAVGFLEQMPLTASL